MDLLALITIGILAGQAAAVFSSYSLGPIGNSIAGLTGTLLISKYVVLLFGLSEHMAQVAGGFAGALVILAVFDAAESFSHKKHRLF
jgi:uncharacterized membrane protein YeaQ/YmgE (transglycosylase-associated protein family)